MKFAVIFKEPLLYVYGFQSNVKKNPSCTFNLILLEKCIVMPFKTEKLLKLAFIIIFIFKNMSLLFIISDQNQ